MMIRRVQLHLLVALVTVEGTKVNTLTAWIKHV